MRFVTSSSWKIRRLQQSDVRQLLDIISGVRGDFGLATRVDSLLEPNDYAILDVYRHRRSAYFVAATETEILGGAGISPLTNGDWGTCELQRMYLRPQSRGQGIGQSLLSACIDTSRALGFERCYAETIAEMTDAIAFYERNKFERLFAPIGETGHSHNDVWMMLQLGPAKLPI
jgi:putative acetyltransferase